MTRTSALQDYPDAAEAPDDAPGSEPEAPSCSLRAFLQYATETLSPELAMRALALASQLPDAQIEALLALLRAMDDRAVATQTDEEDATWQGILAHVPGLAPSLEVIRAHVQGVEAPCSAAGACALCPQ
jgi:hypothetical protein